MHTLAHSILGVQWSEYWRSGKQHHVAGTQTVDCFFISLETVKSSFRRHASAIAEIVVESLGDVDNPIRENVGSGDKFCRSVCRIHGIHDGTTAASAATD
jgi:hypothetical protein